MAVRKGFHLLMAASLSLVAAPLAAQGDTVDFGDDSNEYANDGDCDDPRFAGPGMDGVMLTDDIGRDASDCRAEFEAGDIYMSPLFAKPASRAAIIFGDNTSEFANNGECDDIRFVGPDTSGTIFLFESVGHDARDCRVAFEAGTLKWQGHLANPERGLTYEDLTD
jgi:hypothetical protein